MTNLSRTAFELMDIKFSVDFFLFTSKTFKKGVYYNPYFTIKRPNPKK